MSGQVRIKCPRCGRWTAYADDRVLSALDSGCECGYRYGRIRPAGPGWYWRYSGTGRWIYGRERPPDHYGTGADG